MQSAILTEYVIGVQLKGRWNDISLGRVALEAEKAERAGMKIFWKVRTLKKGEIVEWKGGK
jgi:hypothetical protein